MRFWLLLACLLLLTSSLFAADVVSDFNDGTFQGWTAYGDNIGATNPGTGGNPGGFIQKVDSVTGTPCWMVAPGRYLGDWRGMAGISVDLIRFYGTKWWSNVKIQISGPGGNYTRVFDSMPSTAWSTYSVALDEPLWTRTSGSWNALLANVTDFRILLEYIGGDEMDGMDNVRLIDAGVRTTIGAAKGLPNGRRVDVDGVVSRIADGFFYISSADRSAAIRVNGQLGLTEGTAVTLLGDMASTNGERVITNALVQASSADVVPRPFMISSRDFNGGGLLRVGSTPATSWIPKSMGMLVRMCGKLTKTSPQGDFHLDAGGMISGKCSLDAACPPSGTVVTLTGICTMPETGNTPVLLLTKDDSQIVKSAYGVNLIKNPAAEEGPAGISGEPVARVPGWATTTGFTTTSYGYIYLPAESALINGGRSFFFCGIDTLTSEATQDIDVSSLSTDINANLTKAELSGYIGGRGVEGDYGSVTATYYSATNTVLGTIKIGPQAASNGHLIFHKSSGNIPANTRRIQIKIRGDRRNGSNCDAFFDNLSFIVSHR